MVSLGTPAGGRKKPAPKSAPNKVPALPADQKLAGDLRAEMIKALAPVCALLDKAAANGLSMSFGINRENPTGLNKVTHVIVSRNL